MHLIVTPWPKEQKKRKESFLALLQLPLLFLFPPSGLRICQTEISFFYDSLFLSLYAPFSAWLRISWPKHFPALLSTFRWSMGGVLVCPELWPSPVAESISLRGAIGTMWAVCKRK